MTEPTPSEQIQELLAGYALGDLSPEEAEELKQLLARNTDLVDEVNQLQEVLATMPYSLPEVLPSPHLRSATLKAATEISESPTSQNQKRKLLPLVSTGIAALLALVFGSNNYHLRQQLALERAKIAQQQEVIAMLENSQTKLVALKSMETTSTASGNVIYTPGYPEGVLLIQNLPVLPPGKFYQLWCLVDGKKVGSGAFNSSPQGRVFVKLPFSFNAAISGFAITIEVSPNPPTPQGSTVMMSKL
jgi:hypothetical protein